MARCLLAGACDVIGWPETTRSTGCTAASASVEFLAAADPIVPSTTALAAAAAAAGAAGSSDGRAQTGPSTDGDGRV